MNSFLRLSLRSLGPQKVYQRISLGWRVRTDTGRGGAGQHSTGIKGDGQQGDGQHGFLGLMMVGHKNSLKIKKCEDNTHTTYHRSQTHIHTFLSHSRRPRDYFYILSGMTNQDREGQRRTDLGQKSQFDVEKTHTPSAAYFAVKATHLLCMQYVACSRQETWVYAGTRDRLLDTSICWRITWNVPHAFT